MKPPITFKRHHDFVGESVAHGHLKNEIFPHSFLFPIPIPSIPSSMVGILYSFFSVHDFLLRRQYQVPERSGLLSLQWIVPNCFVCAGVDY